MTATQTAPPATQLLTTAEVCERLRIGRTKFYTLRRALEAVGKMPEPVWLGGSQRCLRWREADLPAFIEAFTAAQS